MYGGHSHSHPHGSHARHGTQPSFDRTFAVATFLNVAIVAVEVLYGYLANSMALLADAAHNVSDILALLLAWGAYRLGARRPTSKRTYGLGSASVLAALINAGLLLMALGGIAIEAIRRLWHGAPVESETVFWVALAAIVFNSATAMLFWQGRGRDLNIEGSFLHMVTDAAVSAGVLIAALVIGWTGWDWFDPVISLAIVGLIFAGTWQFLTESVNLALHAVPSSVNREAVERYLASLPGVVEVHDLHIWALSTTENALTAHLVRPGWAPDDRLLAAIADELRTHHNIGHTTLQIECGDTQCNCALERRDTERSRSR